MKKLVSCLFVAALAMTAFGCGKEAPASSASQEFVNESLQGGEDEKLAEAEKTAENEKPAETEMPSEPEVLQETSSEEPLYEYAEEDYFYSEGDYYEDDSYDDSYYDGDYDGGYYVPDEYNNGSGGYFCSYGTYYAYDSDNHILASLSVYNSEGAMFADFTINDYGPDKQSLYAFICCNASDAFGDASRDTEVEMHVEGDIYGNNTYSDSWLENGVLDVVVYYPEDKATLSYVAGNGERFSYTMYP